jgi:hypothetical protein
MHNNEDKLVQRTYMHLMSVDMNAYAFWTKPEGMFSHAYIPNHQVRNMHVHGLKKESVQSKDILSKEIFPGSLNQGNSFSSNHLDGVHL